MRESDAALHFNPVTLSDTPHYAAEVAETVNRNHRSLVERRGEECAGHVGTMVFDKVKARLRYSRQPRALEFGLGLRQSDPVRSAVYSLAPRRRTGGGTNDLPNQMSTRVAGDRN